MSQDEVDEPGDRHGPRLTGEEYDQRLVALHESAPAMPSAAQDRELRRAELDLRIDHRLGRDFPAERREEMWRVQQEVEKRRLWLTARYVVGRLVGRRRPPVRGAGSLAGWMVDRFAVVLDRDELERYFDLRGDEPALPYDPQGHRPPD